MTSALELLRPLSPQWSPKVLAASGLDPAGGAVLADLTAASLPLPADRLADGLATSLAGADLIVHAGDVGSAGVLEALGAAAPVLAIAGNNDVPEKWSRTERARRCAAPGGTSATTVSTSTEWVTIP